MTPELIRAAERCKYAMDVHGVAGNLCDVQMAVGAIIAHRSDYSENGEELPVDPEFCREMGAEWEETFLVWEDDIGWLLALDEVDGEWSVYGHKLPENAWPTTRPQLRRLLNALGIGGAA